MAASRDARGWLVALADMPCIRVATLQAVAELIGGGAALAAPSYAGRRGHPVGFAARWRDALLALEGDEGARAILTGDANIVVAGGTETGGTGGVWGR